MYCILENFLNIAFQRQFVNYKDIKMQTFILFIKENFCGKMKNDIYMCIIKIWRTNLMHNIIF